MVNSKSLDWINESRFWLWGETDIKDWNQKSDFKSERIALKVKIMILKLK